MTVYNKNSDFFWEMISNLILDNAPMKHDKTFLLDSKERKSKWSQKTH